MENLDNQELVKRVSKFSDESMRWAASQSEEATAQVGKILDHLFEDSERINAMSEESIQLLNDLKGQLEEDPTEKKKTTAILRNLAQVCKRNSAIKDQLFPILETLQFQDRIRQNMENINKAINIWVSARESIVDQSEPLSSEQKTAFGQQVVDAMTMAAERDIISSHVEGITVAKDEEEDILLF